MDNLEFRSFVSGERLKLVRYVRTLLRETAELDAEDVVHDVLLKIGEKTDLMLPLEDLAAYTYRSLRNRVIDYFRTRKAMLSLEDAGEEEGLRLIDLLSDMRPSALEALETQEGRAKLFEALEGLSEIERDVIVAHEFERVPFKELSRAWKVPQNTLLSHKSRAMKKLRKRFGNNRKGTQYE